MADYSEPYYEATKYTIYPTGAKQFSPEVVRSYCIYVEKFYDTGRWRVHDGFSGGHLLSRTGNWLWDTPLNRQWTRFDTLQDALLAAMLAVDKRVGKMSLVELMERLDKR